MEDDVHGLIRSSALRLEFPCHIHHSSFSLPHSYSTVPSLLFSLPYLTFIKLEEFEQLRRSTRKEAK